jgi:rhamnulokinase
VTGYPGGSYAAVDLGASSGRVIVGRVGDGTLELAEVHRFGNEPVRLPSGLHWDVVALYRETVAGLRRAEGAVSAGIDTWAVDYGLLDDRGGLLGLPYHYRDERTAPPLPLSVLGAEELYAITGIQHLPFNTVYQLATEPPARLAAAGTLLLVPDLLGYWLTGTVGAERTNASTTALLDVTAGGWSAAVATRLGLPAGLLPPLREPGDRIGAALPHTGVEVPLVAVGSHDTASAVLAVPASSPRFAYVSAGTWSLAGVELDEPVLTAASREANFTNEVGVDGTIRYLRNVMGLWLLQECQRGWDEPDTAALVEAAAKAPPFAAVVDPDDPAFLPPGDMPARIAEHCRRTGQQPSATAPRSATRSASPTTPSTWCTWSAAAPATPCCASSPPTPAACRWWPARSRPPPSATSWCRPAPTAAPPTAPRCGPWSPRPPRCTATSPRATRRPGTPPRPGPVAADPSGAAAAGRRGSGGPRSR